MDAIMKHKDNVSAVIVWGVTDDLSWRVKQSPLLFDGDYVAKPAYYSLTKGMDVPEVVTTTTKPAETTTTSTATTTAEETTTTKGTSGGDLPIAKIIGDANGDAKVTVSDAVAILQYIGNKDKYPLTAEQLENADCYNPGDGVTPRDALSIQRLDAKAISSLPELAE